MQSLLQGKQEIQWYLKNKVWLLYRAGHCTWSGLKKGIKDKEYMYIIGTDVFDQIQCLCLKERDGQF